MPQLSLTELDCCFYFFDKKASEKVPLFNVCMSHKMILLHPSFGSKEEKTHQQKASRDSNINIYYNRELIASASVQNNNMVFVLERNQNVYISCNWYSIFLLKGANFFGIPSRHIKF